MDLIANVKILVNIRKVRGKDAIRVNCNSRVDIVDKDDDPPGYRTVWYELTGIANILSMSRSTRNFGLFSKSSAGIVVVWSS